MTGENSKRIRYLTSKTVAALYTALARWAEKTDEPIPNFAHADKGGIEALVAAPQQRFFGIEAYPTLEEKAAIIFYTVNKRQIFPNGNKRMSTLCLLVFLGINGKRLDVSENELRDKALWLANTESLDFPAIKDEVTDWIREHLTDLD